ncbi:MAG: ABC transporter ATP-binding protein [Ruminococcaceae bacterium]|nr:ABC transporter ATP-binding protein [Oscillospiraceae bacterium]
MDNVSVQVNHGEFAALIGENGAGKSTFAKLCNGLLKPSRGSIQVKGFDTRTTKTSQLARHIGFLFQNPDRQICQNTVYAEIMFGLELVIPEKARREERCAAILAELELDGSSNPFNLSRGERQRVALASVLAREPDLLILDEPTTGLDWLECIRIMEQIKQRNLAGTTVLMICHDMEVVQDYANRVLVMSGGRLLADGPMAEIMTDEKLLSSASVTSAQIPALTSRFDSLFADIFSPEELAAAIARRVSK